MFQASAATVDLAPPVGGRLIGFFARVKPSTGAHDPIMARAVMLDNGNSKAVIISCDLLGFEVPVAGEIRNRIGKACGIDASNVLLACTHTHSGPDSLASEVAWMADVKAKIVDMVSGLVPALKPARLSHGLTTVTGIGYNRESDQHPIDESLGVIGIGGADGQTIATIINYATHAVLLGPENLEYSSDFPGEVCRHVARLRGGVGIYLQGACGDVDPVVYRDRGWGKGTFDDADETGRKLAEAAVAALADVPVESEVKIHADAKVVDVPLDAPPTQEELDEVAAEAKAQADSDDEVNRRVGKAVLNWVGRIGQAIETGTVPVILPVEISALAINDLRLVGVPFEVFTDIGLDIKNGTKPLETFFVGYANGYCGYYPTRWGKDRGKYGGKTSCRFGFGPLITSIGYGADELLIRQAVALASKIGENKAR
ncbi:MAG: hypothetical protein K8R91_01245 [Phycisphaerae bacterium]|nr:hypothetical protein [Phycisphaerae bacterium]